MIKSLILSRLHRKKVAFKQGKHTQKHTINMNVLHFLHQFTNRK